MENNELRIDPDESRFDLSVLEESLTSDEDDDPDDDEEVEEQVQIDLNDGLILIKRAKTLIDYISDPLLCKSISKREREVMFKLSMQLGDFLSSTVPSYEGVEDGL